MVDRHAGQIGVERARRYRVGRRRRTGGAAQSAADRGSWPAFLASFSDPPEEVQEALRTLGVVFGDGRALDEVRRLALDDKADLEQRRAALQSLIEAEPPDLRELCEKLLKVRFLNTTAMSGLARFNDPAIGQQLARSFGSFHHSERAAVIETLVSRPVFAAELLAQMAAGKIARTDLSAAAGPANPQFRRSSGSRRSWPRCGANCGILPQDKQQLIDKLKHELSVRAAGQGRQTARTARCSPNRAPLVIGCLAAARRSAPT